MRQSLSRTAGEHNLRQRPRCHYLVPGCAARERTRGSSGARAGQPIRRLITEPISAERGQSLNQHPRKALHGVSKGEGRRGNSFPHRLRPCIHVRVWRTGHRDLSGPRISVYSGQVRCRELSPAGGWSGPECLTWCSNLAPMMSPDRGGVTRDRGAAVVDVHDPCRPPHPPPGPWGTDNESAQAKFH